MQRLAQRIWSLSSHCHIGDLAWQRNQHTGREPDWPTALWEDGGEVVAWGWAELPGTLDLLVDPARPELAGEVLAWFADVAAPGTVTVLDAETHVIAALQERGYTPRDSDHYRYLVRTLNELPPPTLPDGFRARPVQAGDLAARVAVHRAAWHPSRVTEDSYQNVMASWPYRPGLDWVIEAPDGRFAASCLVWLDGHNGVGELEPVGTDPEFRRLGLAHAVCLAAMHALRDAGAGRAVVYPVHAVPLYAGLGFTQYARTHTYGRR
jgi:ribosomal protein S18 acetylase RimI-like enzyme